MKIQKNNRFSRVICVIVIALLVCGAYIYLIKAANVIFPINSQEVLAIQVQEHNPGKYSGYMIGSLQGAKQSNFIQEMNALRPVLISNEKKEFITWLHDYHHILYEATIRYNPNQNRFRRESATYIYYTDNGMIIVAYGGFMKYQTDSENYDDFLLLLEEYAEECFISAY